MVQELIIPGADLPPQWKHQILSFYRITWPEGFTGSNRLRNWVSGEENHSVSILLVENGLLISHTEVVWKMLDHAGKTYKAYGLAGVFTYPSFRRQGYGKRVVESGTAYIDDARDGDIGIFHCAPEMRKFYSGCGWIPVDSAVTFVGPKDSPSVSAELMMMRFLSGHGRQGKTDFENVPLYFGEYTW